VAGHSRQARLPSYGRGADFERRKDDDAVALEWFDPACARVVRVRRHSTVGQEHQLSYILGVGGVLLFQAAFSYAIILAGTGNGSFVGLGAMLFAVVGIPFTAIANLVLVHSHRKDPATGCIGRLLLVSLALPVAQLALLILVSVFRL
jgi:hypothetical protein